MKHFVIIRYGLKINHSIIEKRDELFFTKCLPSLIGQTNKNFKVLLVIDESYPVWPYLRLKSKIPKEFISIAICPNNGGVIPSGWLRKYIGIDEQIIMTRIDNDDTIACDYIDEIQRVAKPETVISAKNGYWERDGKYYMSSYPNNMFLSLCSAQGSVYDYQHTKLSQNYPVVNTDNKPYWIHSIHDTAITFKINKDKKYSGESKLDSRFIFK